MDFIDTLRQFAARTEKLYPQIQTEEATKTSLIMPFFQQIFGYDIFNPDEFVPEFTADVGIKKGEKVDYAVILNGEPAILVEAKWCGAPLEKHDSQLFRYFGTTSAKFGILTNGIIYKFYTDLDERNKMDLTPFLELDIINIKESIIGELKRFCKANFNAEEIFSRAAELKYSNDIKAYFSEQLKDPSDDFIKFMMSNTYDGLKTTAAIDRFRPIVKTALNSLISETMNERITAALRTDAAADADDIEVVSSIAEVEPLRIQAITTDEEIQAFYIVKAILATDLDISKVSYKDTVNYFAIIYNGMPTKWICRIRFSEKKKYIGLPAANGNEVKHELIGIDDIYRLSAEIIAAAQKVK
jgi:hypothetical protein